MYQVHEWEESTFLETSGAVNTFQRGKWECRADFGLYMCHQYCELSLYVNYFLAAVIWYIGATWIRCSNTEENDETYIIFTLKIYVAIFIKMYCFE